VRGLHHVFPTPDPPVYSRPQLKPSHGICCFTMTTFGAHRGADQGAGRSASGQDLHHLLRGSTSAPPLSTSALLQLPGSTSTRPGRHTAISDLHRHLRAGAQLPRAGIFMSRPTYVGPGSTPAFPRPAYMLSHRNIRPRAGIYQFWPFLAGISSSWAGLALSRPVLGALGPGWVSTPAQLQFRLGRLSSSPPGPKQCESCLGRRAASPGWAGAMQTPAGPVLQRSGRSQPHPPRSALGPGWALASAARPSSQPAVGPLLGRGIAGQQRPGGLFASSRGLVLCCFDDSLPSPARADAFPSRGCASDSASPSKIPGNHIV
jgi:hypothetical protein